ncbi:Cellulose synthase-like protein E1 [Gossypium arboreum]|uniref:Cellulose synthase-like protein E1 n=1 Tax=Gossypium arboreum TaxID=29729 RepID=A0A0B0N555_GOSAR|nr:Cellulose synthase-like protein E1 [Gossypium arboreum]
MGNDGYLPLFETKRANGRTLYRVFAGSIFVGICLIWSYRVSHVPRDGEDGRLVWIGLLAAELWFGFYWFLTQAHRWNLVYRQTFKDRLSHRYGNQLPGVDIFVCTADPVIEPPMMVINTVLSVMAYDYPPEKLSKLYEDMKNQVENVAKLGRLPEVHLRHKGFSEWDSYSSRHDHDTILQILIDGKDPNAKDSEGCVLPTLVYVAREKRQQYFHNFKAGAMNALIRVSSAISNGQIVLNVDCDMYSNNSLAVRDALCFFMDEKKGHEIAYVQFPQNFDNITKNELYSSSLRVISQVEFHGLDGYGGPLYIGTGCFHRRDTLCGRQFSREIHNEFKIDIPRDREREETTAVLEEKSKVLASCTYENNTEWGKEMGLKYGCPVEDVITGLSIQCRGWKSVYYNPERKAFLGVAPTTLAQILVQHKRWSEGDFQILLSKYSPAWFANGKISLGLQLGYCCYCLWATNCLAVLYYSIVPSLYLLRGIPLFPELSSPWFFPFAYVVISNYMYSLAEYLWNGGTVLGWWNDQRIWLYKRTSSYLLGFIDIIAKSLGLHSDSTFVITAKVSKQEVYRRYVKEIMEFGDSTPMFTALATIALINLVCLIGLMKKAIVNEGIPIIYETMLLQFVLCAILVLINWPLYQGLFFRKDNGKMPNYIAIKSIVLAVSSCTCFTLFST